MHMITTRYIYIYIMNAHDMYFFPKAVSKRDGVLYILKLVPTYLYLQKTNVWMLSPQIDLLFSYGDGHTDLDGNQYIDHDKLLAAVRDVRQTDDKGSDRYAC